MTEGTVRDIRTGRAVAKTRNLTETFITYVRALLTEDKEFYIVHGRCRHQEVRKMLTVMADEGLLVIYDPQITSDLVYIFEGDPAELGFSA